MLKSLKIENFRGFQSFELQQLGRINLLVGLNNSGKTAVLEAIHLLCSQGSFDALREVMTIRGEYLSDDEGNRELDIRHLFYGHEVKIDEKLSVSAINNSLQEKVFISVEENSQLNLFNDLQELEFVIEWFLNQKPELTKLPLSSTGGLPANVVRLRRDSKKLSTRTQFITSSSLTTQRMVELFDRVVLTPEEQLVNEALRTIEPEIERIASVSSQPFRFSSESRTGFVIRVSSSEKRVPIGSMGDGIWRILGLALSTVCARGRVLLVDEIDTGLHFTAMANMWKLIWETARRLDVQVFATTHSRDCWESLAELVESNNIAEGEVTIQRIERDKPRSVIFDGREMVIAAERGIEVR